MLQYLVTSKVRRRLLLLVWAEAKRGSVAELAELAGVAFASAHTELTSMYRARLVTSEHVGGKQIYAANFDHPEAAALQSLVSAPVLPPQAPTAADELLKSSLVALGAPLRGVEPREVAPGDLMATLVRGAELARRDAVVARSLPLCVWNARASLAPKPLASLAMGTEDKHAVGFFLELAGELGGDRRLVGLSEGLRDRRLTTTRGFFKFSSARRETVRDFALAAKWGFRMNMDLASFRSLFDKFVTR